MELATYFYLAFRQAGITQEDTERIINLLSTKTLRQITQNGFDRRLIRPLLMEADRLINETCADDGEENMNLETAVKQILENKKEMFVLMKEYCLEE